nr:conserved oligomeric Golgi complex subunit 8 isoform X1 [Leptinotarsa decemlineata]XP_023026435.1 conserved oligomeric Golgi complex subunit 8 isoform X2 [Leptinotarsa decemlineata]
MSDTENLLKLFLDGSHSNEFENDGHIQEYLSKLGTYKVENLLKEPDRLKNEAIILKEQIQELAVTNYKTFIETAECSKELYFHFNAIENKVDQLLVDIPKFEKNCIDFGEKSSGINDLRKLNTSTLAKSAKLLEILELPQLMNSFLSDGLYEDVLELAAYVRKLHHKHPDISIFSNIAADVDKAWLRMLHQLLSQLREDVSLPKCLQIIGILRRMEIFTEPELRWKFLQSRNCWLNHCLKEIPKQEVDHHLTKKIEVIRVKLFNILTQYRAIFNDDEHSPLMHITENKNINQNIIVFSWVKDKISEFFTILDKDLEGVTSIESIMDQCMYFGSSFSKVGCDFRPMMVPMFTSVIQKKFTKSVEDASRNFAKNIDKFTLIDKNHPNIQWKTNKEDQMQPPDSLLEFYPLAEYLNNILTTLNNLRLCAPIAIVNDVVMNLQESLVFISESLLKLYTQEHQAFTTSSKDAFTKLCMAFYDELVPFIQKCIHVIYQPSQIASKLGVSVNALQKENITFLDKSVIISHIKHLLPAKTEPDIINIMNEHEEILQDVTN